MKELKPNGQQVLDLKDLLKSSTWDTYKFFVEDEIKDLENQMFENEELTEKQRDALRNKRNNLKYALEMPGLIIEASRPRRKQKEPNPDVY